MRECSGCMQVMVLVLEHERDWDRDGEGVERREFGRKEVGDMCV